MQTNYPSHANHHRQRAHKKVISSPGRCVRALKEGGLVALIYGVTVFPYLLGLAEQQL